MDRLKKIKAEIDALMAEMESADNSTDNAPAKRAAAHDSTTQAGPTHTSPTDEALMQSIEIELEEIRLLEV